MILDDEGKIKEVVEKSLIEFYSTRNTSPKMPIESKLVNAFVNSIFNDSLVDVYNKLKNYMSGDGKEFGFLKSYSSDIMYVPRKYWYIVAYAITRKDKTLFELISRAFYDNENVTVDYGDPDGTYTDEDLLTDTGEHTDIVLGLITIMFESFAYNNPVDITKYPRGSVAWEDWLEKGDVFDHLISIIHPARINVRNVPVLYGNKKLLYETQDTDVNFMMPYPWDTFDEELFNNMVFKELYIHQTTPRVWVPLIKYKKTKIDDNTIRHDMTFQGLTVGAESNPYDIGPVEYQASSMSYPIVYPFGNNDFSPVFESHKTHLVSSTFAANHIITSKDGLTWENKQSMNPSRSPFDKIIYCDKLQCYIGIVDYGIYKCTDPKMIVWEQVYLPTVSSELVVLRDIIYEKNKLIVVGDGGVILTSYDAITWTRKIISNKNLYNIAYGSKQDVFVIVGTGIILRSKDHGDSWNAAIESTNYYRKICYAENIDKFIVVSATVIYSLTGDTSDLRSVAYVMTDDGITDIAYSKDKGILVISVEGRYSYSIRWAYEKDVSIWSYVPTNQVVRFLYYAPIRKIFLGGSHGNGGVLVSEDGKNWVKGETPSNLPPYGFAEGVDLASIKTYTLNSVTATLENLAVPQSLYENNNNRVRLVIDTILPQE